MAEVPLLTDDPAHLSGVVRTVRGNDQIVRDPQREDPCAVRDVLSSEIDEQVGARRELLHGRGLGVGHHAAPSRQFGETRQGQAAREGLGPEVPEEPRQRGPLMWRREGHEVFDRGQRGSKSDAIISSAARATIPPCE